MRKRSGIFDGKTVLPVTAASFAMVFLIMSMLLTSFQAVIPILYQFLLQILRPLLLEKTVLT